jgi:hypothetical protein
LKIEGEVLLLTFDYRSNFIYFMVMGYAGSRFAFAADNTKIYKMPFAFFTG